MSGIVCYALLDVCMAAAIQSDHNIVLVLGAEMKQSLIIKLFH